MKQDKTDEIISQLGLDEICRDYWHWQHENPDGYTGY